MCSAMLTECNLAHRDGGHFCLPNKWGGQSCFYFSTPCRCTGGRLPRRYLTRCNWLETGTTVPLRLPLATNGVWRHYNRLDHRALSSRRRTVIACVRTPI